MRGPEAINRVVERPLYELPQVFLPQRLEAEHLAPREEGRVHREGRVLGRRADERDGSVLDVRKKRVLLGLVESVNLVDEDDGALALVGKPLLGLGDDDTQIRDAPQDGAERHKMML